MSLEYEEVSPTPGFTWSEEVTVPRWIWRFVARYEIGFDPSVADPLASLPLVFLGVDTAEPETFDGNMIYSDFVEAVAGSSGPPTEPSLLAEDRAEHVRDTMAGLIRHTLEPYLQASEGPLAAHLATAAIQSNPVVTGAPPWSWEVLALDAVELYDGDVGGYADSGCGLSSVPDGQVLGLAPVVRASPNHPVPPSDIPVSDPLVSAPFHSVVLDQALAQGISADLGMGDLTESFSLSLPGAPWEKHNALQEPRLQQLIERLVDGALDWTVAQEPDAYDCAQPANDLRNACVQASLLGNCTPDFFDATEDVCEDGRQLTLTDVPLPEPPPEGGMCMSVLEAERMGGALVSAAPIGAPGCTHQSPFWEVDHETGRLTLHLSECAEILTQISAWVNFTAGIPANPGDPVSCPTVPEQGVVRPELAPSVVPPNLGVWAQEGAPTPWASLDILVGFDLVFTITASYSIPLWFDGLDYYAPDNSDCGSVDTTLRSWEPVEYWLDEMAGEFSEDCAGTFAVFGGLESIPATEYSLAVDVLPPVPGLYSARARGGFPVQTFVLNPSTPPFAPPSDQWLPLPPGDLPEDMVDGALGSVTGTLSTMLAGVNLDLPVQNLAFWTLQGQGYLASEPQQSAVVGGMPPMTSLSLLQNGGADAVAPLVLALRSGNLEASDCEGVENLDDATAVCGNYLRGTDPGEGWGSPNLFVGAHHFLLARTGLFDAAWPTRAAALDLLLDEACDTMTLPGPGSCADYVLISLAGEQAPGSDGALWLFRPDPGLSSGWQPGRLP